MSDPATPSPAPGAGPSPTAPATAPTPATPAPAPPALIDIDQFKLVDMRVGRIVAAAAHEKADKLLVLKVDIGEAEPRQVVAGIRSDWAPEQLIGRAVIIAANLKPAMLRGVESRGMMLAVRGAEKVIPLGVDGNVSPGTRVT